MFKRFLATILSGLMLQVLIGFGPVYAQSDESDQLASKARAEVSSLGTGKRVEVKLRDNTKIKGIIIETTENSFSLADSESATARTIAYTDVVKVKKAGSGSSLKTWGIIGGAVAGAIVTWIIVKPALCDGGAQTRGPC